MTTPIELGPSHVRFGIDRSSAPQWLWVALKALVTGYESVSIDGNHVAMLFDEPASREGAER